MLVDAEERMTTRCNVKPAAPQEMLMPNGVISHQASGLLQSPISLVIKTCKAYTCILAVVSDASLQGLYLSYVER